MGGRKGRVVDSRMYGGKEKRRGQESNREIGMAIGKEGGNETGVRIPKSISVDVVVVFCWRIFARGGLGLAFGSRLFGLPGPIFGQNGHFLTTVRQFHGANSPQFHHP